MEIILDFSPFIKFAQLSPGMMLKVFFTNFAWPFFGLIFVIGVRDLYLFWLRGKWAKTHKFTLLAIDIPRGNEQSPKAVENMFTYLGGAQGGVNFFEKWFEGLFQKSFSFEIVSIGGHTQFLVRTPSESRNLVESAIYSQYPDAEIFEVEDYVNNVPHKVPNDEYDFWGSEFIQVTSDVYPIKCYREFEDQTAPNEIQFKDPMASFMDLCASMNEDEQFWFQMIVIPLDFKWIKRSEAEINKILGRKKKPKQSLTTKALVALGELSESIYPIWGDTTSSEKEERPKTMMDLNPTEKEKVEAINAKASKLGFEVKIRVIYMAKKESLNRAKAVSGFVGYIKQFLSMNLNSLRPELKRTTTKSAYFRKKSRLIRKKRNTLNAYIERSDSLGAKPGVFNIEELATLWHFPIEASSGSAMLQKVPGKKATAPASLPIDDGPPGGAGKFLNFFSDDDVSEKDFFESDEKDSFKNDFKNSEEGSSKDNGSEKNNLEKNSSASFFEDNNEGRGNSGKGVPANLPFA